MPIGPVPGGDPGVRPLGAPGRTSFSRATPVPAWIEKSPALPPAVPGSALSAPVRYPVLHRYQQRAVCAPRAGGKQEASSLGALGQYEVEFQPEYQQLQLHTLRVLRDGAVIDKLASADIRFLQRETSLDQGIYSGSVTAAIVTEDVRVGDTLEMEYSIIGQNPVFGGKFFHAAAWDAAMPVAQRRVSLNMPERRVIHSRLIGGERGQQPVMSSANRDGRRILRFEGRALPQTLPEPYVPNDVQAYRYLQFSEFDNWRDVNQWALGLFATGDTSATLKDVLAAAGGEGQGSGSGQGARIRAERYPLPLHFAGREFAPPIPARPGAAAPLRATARTSRC
ncbi:DUF3857 domain-containing protein [Massilia sp. H-1]|nr:DUF3857 domain-containing protein [Massilia sp. H-1]